MNVRNCTKYSDRPIIFTGENFSPITRAAAIPS
jgi:hypothetical protein